MTTQERGIGERDLTKFNNKEGKSKNMTNICMHRKLSICLFQALILFSFSCKQKASNGEMSRVEAPTIIIPTEERVVEAAKIFASIYLKNHLKNQDPKAFLAQVDDMMNGDFSPTFNIHHNRWHVFFTDGMESLNVTLSKELNEGTARALNSKVISSDPAKVNLKRDFSDVPLFTLSEFERLVDLPHNR